MRPAGAWHSPAIAPWGPAVASIARVSIRVEVGGLAVVKLVELALSPTQAAQAARCRLSAAHGIARQAGELVKAAQPQGWLDPAE